MLTLSDLNQIIKFYAYRIQQRIEELEHLNFSFNLQQDPDPDNQQYEFIAIVSKYHHYTTNDERQVKLAKKLAERIVQIYQFFKMKSNNQNLLHLIQQKIQIEIKKIVNQIPMNLGELFSYVHFITKKGCVIRVPAAEKKRALSKSIARQSHKMDGKLAPTLSLFNIQRRATSIASSDKPKFKPPLVINQKLKVEEVINGIWNGLEVDRHHLAKVKDGNESYTTKQMIKRNQKIGQTIAKYDRRCKKTTTQSSAFDDPKQSVILTEIKTNTIKAIWFSKKRRQVMSSKKRNTILKENISTVS